MKFVREQLFLTEEEKQSHFWVQDSLHFPHPFTPLYSSFMIPAMTEGTKLAFRNLRLPVQQFIAKYVDGYYYQAMPMVPNPHELVEEHQQLMRNVFPHIYDNLLEQVDQTLLPYYRQLDRYARETCSREQAVERIEELFAFYQKAFQLHFELVFPRLSLGMALEELYHQLTGEQEAAPVYDLLLGVMNKSLETDRGLWKLAQQIKDSPALSELFYKYKEENWIEVLQQSEAGKKIWAELGEFLRIYGFRTAISHEFVEETWVENPLHALRIIKEYVEKEYDFDVEFSRVVKEREEKVNRLFASLPDNEAKAAFRELHGMALKCWGLDEDHHFFIDTMLPAKSRIFLLKIGVMLVNDGSIREREDIFYLYVDEVIDLLQTPREATSLVAVRKGEYLEQSRKSPAPFLGTPPVAEADPLMERVFGIKPPVINDETHTFEGYAGCKGTFTGPVKVVGGQADFGKVQKGDVLVCKTTQPPWTVLFTLVGAIVTDTGGILSHAATVAREYQLPCVVGTKVATSLLKDGDVVTVDGTTGMVTIHGRT